MAEGTYEHECMRAELLGTSKPDREQFEKTRAEQLKQQEEEELAAAETKLVAEQDDALRNNAGKLDELNSILSSTQQKLNRFKQSACGSLSNMFGGRGSVDLGDSHLTPSTSATASRRNTTASGGLFETAKECSNLKVALENLDEMQQSGGGGTDKSERGEEENSEVVQPRIPTEVIRNAKLDLQKKMGSHLDKLDSLINKAEQAEASMSAQTKQMKKYTK